MDITEVALEYAYVGDSVGDAERAAARLDEFNDCIDGVRAQAWEEALQAYSWALENGPTPMEYTLRNNPYRRT